jgi:hypothetical protein
MALPSRDLVQLYNSVRQSSGEKLNHEVVMIKEAAAAAPLLNDSVPFCKSNTTFYLLCNEADSQLKDPDDKSDVEGMAL